MNEKIISFKESCENDVVCAVQGTYKQKRIFLENNYDEETAKKNSLKWGIAQVEKGIGTHFSKEDAVKSLREMSNIAKQLSGFVY